MTDCVGGRYVAPAKKKVNFRPLKNEKYHISLFAHQTHLIFNKAV